MRKICQKIWQDMMWVTGIDAGWTEIATNFKMWDILGELDTLFTDAILQVNVVFV